MATTSNEIQAEPRIAGPVQLCDEQGRLNRSSIGWSPVTLHDINFSGSYFRKKRYDVWGVQSEDAYFCTALVDLDYLGYAFAFLNDFRTKQFVEQRTLTPFCRGIQVARNVENESYLRSRRMRISYHRQPPTSEHDGSVLVEVDAKLPDGRPFVADFTVEYSQGQETMNVVIPWSDRQFHFTSKHTALPVHGVVKVGAEMTRFDRERSSAWLDFGRGIWPYESAWNWSITGGIVNGRRIGFNLGSGWTDGTGMTENALFIDGKVCKLAEQVRFDYDPSDVMKPWAIRTVGTDRLDLRFLPVYDRLDQTNALIIKSSLHQVLGHFEGTLISDSGELIPIHDLVGVVEEHMARW